MGRTHPRLPQPRLTSFSNQRSCWTIGETSIVGSQSERPDSTPERIEPRLDVLSGIERQDWTVLAAQVLFAAIFFVAPWAPVSYGALGVLLVLSWLRLDLALLLVPLFCPFFLEPRHFSLGAGRSKEFAPSEVFLVADCVLAAIMLCVPATRGRFSFDGLRRSPFLLPAALLVLAGALSTFAAYNRHDALEWYRWTVLEPLALFILVLALERRPPGWKLLLLSVIGAALLAGALALLHGDAPIAAPPPGSQDQLPRIRGPYGSADNLGLLLDRALPLWLALVLVTRRRWLLPGVVLVPALVFTFSRGAWLATLLGCLLVVALTLRQRRRLLLGAVAVVVVLGAAGSPFLVRALENGHAGTVHRRLDLWDSSLHMIRDYPLLGIGPDNFMHYYAPTRKENLWQRFCPPGLGYIQRDAGAEPCLSHPHDEILDFWLSTGVLGLASYLWLQVVFWRTSAALWQSGRRTLPWVLTVGAMGAMLAALVHGLVDEGYFLPDLSFLFWVLCAFVSWGRTATERHQREPL